MKINSLFFLFCLVAAGPAMAERYPFVYVQNEEMAKPLLGKDVLANSLDRLVPGQLEVELYQALVVVSLCRGRDCSQEVLSFRPSAFVHDGDYLYAEGVYRGESYGVQVGTAIGDRAPTFEIYSKVFGRKREILRGSWKIPSNYLTGQ